MIQKGWTMRDRVHLSILTVVLAGLVAGLITACGGGASADPPTVPAESAAAPVSPTVAPFLIPSTPTPAALLPPVDQTVLDLLGAGPIKEFPQELMPGILRKHMVLHRKLFSPAKPAMMIGTLFRSRLLDSKKIRLWH